MIVDTEEKIRTFLPQLDDLVTGGALVTLDPVEIIRYVGGGHIAAPASRQAGD